MPDLTLAVESEERRRFQSYSPDLQRDIYRRDMLEFISLKCGGDMELMRKVVESVHKVYKEHHAALPK